ncbi:hypothetical protein [Sphingomonas beigongshangi]|uniref:hypothetical protein n=1 Tax=Sphingomonas beigongshangi TaxID=2782540 RepID=UPI00193C802C|nr:hypothetical protein [Sphingomonas beigongshangi]
MIDYDTARFKSSLVAAAAGIEINTFRAYFKRGHFLMLGETEQLAASHGVAHMWSLRDALGFAIAGELIRVGVDAGKAFKAAMWGFAHVGSMQFDPPIPGMPPARQPGELWDAQQVGFTFMAFFPATGAVRVFPASNQIQIAEAIEDPETHKPSASVLLFLNDIETRVLEALGVDRNPPSTTGEPAILPPGRTACQHDGRPAKGARRG